MSDEDSTSINASAVSSSFGCGLSNEKGTLVQTVLGGSVLFLFLLTWFASLGSPLLAVLWILHEQYVPAFALFVATLIAYLPWKKGYISGVLSRYARCNTMYYQKCRVMYQSEGSVPRANHGGVPRQRPLLYAVHPHGAFCMGWSVLFCSQIMDEGRVRFCFSPALYASPLFRLWSRLVGRPGSASKTSMIDYMKGKLDAPGDHLALPPGGFEEATLTCSGKDRVFIKKRVGFIKLALQNGYNVVPVYSFGENETFWNAQGLWKLRLWLNSFGMPAIIVLGSWLFPLMPKRHPLGMLVVIGKPLVLPRIAKPTREEVKLWHDKYIASLTRLFEEHKEDYYGPDMAKSAKLELW